MKLLKSPSSNTDKSRNYDIQIHSSQLYAFEPLICDAIYNHNLKIADIRRSLSLPNVDKLQALTDIERSQGEVVILEEILSQLHEQGL